jgi:hypothetical protein
MFIMMYIAFRKHKNFNSTLLSVFYRDGIFYFICLSGASKCLFSDVSSTGSWCVDYDVALASANIVVNLAAPEGGFKFLLVQYVSPSLTPIVHYLNSTYTVLL